jgi:hypothetical protein
MTSALTVSRLHPLAPCPWLEFYNSPLFYVDVGGMQRAEAHLV